MNISQLWSLGLKLHMENRNHDVWRAPWVFPAVNLCSRLFITNSLRVLPFNPFVIIYSADKYPGHKFTFASASSFEIFICQPVSRGCTIFIFGRFSPRGKLLRNERLAFRLCVMGKFSGCIDPECTTPLWSPSRILTSINLLNFVRPVLYMYVYIS